MSPAISSEDCDALDKVARQEDGQNRGCHLGKWSQMGGRNADITDIPQA